ncbi:hypothetical protein [Streptomyces microflavus]
MSVRCPALTGSWPKRATGLFRAAVTRPGFAEAFDRDFGGLPQRRVA